MYLYINATDPRAPIEIRLWEGGEWQVFSFERVVPSGPLGALDEFLKQRHKTIFDVRALFVFMGQGSFTATRSITTIANALALAATIPVIAVNAPPVGDPALSIPAISSGKYVVPEYSAPARIGGASAPESSGDPKPAQI